jgi:serine/threonine-protein kinase
MNWDERMIGQTLSHYHITGKLGAGGMGEVYLARDTRLDRKVALKILPEQFTKDESLLGRFVQEAKAASALNHPNIITIYDVGEAGGLHYIAMEFIDGDTLRGFMTGAQLRLPDALDIAAQVASALAAAHASGIVHRDIKPENMIVGRDKQVKVLDFGLAKLTARPLSVDTNAATALKVETDPGTVMGTARYMSPEQARGQELDARTDIFSFGVVLYEMIAGRHPFQGSTATDVISSILTKDPLPVSRVEPEAPPELERIVSKAMEKDREERYQVIKDLLLDLKRLKRRLEFEAERLRSGEPATTSDQAVGPVAVSVEAVEELPPKTVEIGAVRTPSSAEHLVSRVKLHKRAALVSLLVLIVAAAGIAYYWQASSNQTAIDSIAVLPFVNQSRDPDTEYLADGLTESIINKLTQLADLRVIARSSAFRYKGKEADPFGAGQDLGVRAVVVGRVLQRGEQLMVSAELVDVRGNKQLWGEQYNRKMSDLVAVQQQISREITEKLRAKLTREGQTQLGRGETSNAEAYQCYLRGRYFWNRRTGGGLKKALVQFQEAVDKDPTYALAYAGLADCYALLEVYAGTQSSETLPKARAAAQRALQIDDSLAEAHTSLGYINTHSWQFGEAEKEFRRGIELNPNYPTAHHWYSVYLRAMGQFDQAMVEVRRARQLDPLSPVISVNIVMLYIAMGDLSSAFEECKKIIELDPTFPAGHSYLGWIYLKQGPGREAIAEFHKAVELSGRGSQELGYLGYGYGALGKRAEAMAVLKELEKKHARQESPGIYLAAVYAGLGEKDQAFAWLEKDFQVRNGVLIYITYHPDYDTLRDDPRYEDLLRRMGLRR